MARTDSNRPGIVIVGAGPAGIAAAVRASACGKKVTLVDDNPSEGGQIWRGGPSKPASPQASKWFNKLEVSGAKFLSGCRIVDADAKARTLLAELPGTAVKIEYTDLILATGARELFLPFPGWTLPNVMGAGGLQGLVKAGLPVKEKRIVVAGSGPLLLAVASQLRKYGATVPIIVEQADWANLAGFLSKLALHPGKLLQAFLLRASLGAATYHHGAWVKSAEGDGKLSRIQIQSGSRTFSVDCDYLAIAYGFVPNTELAQLLGCGMKNGLAAVDEYQRSTISGVLCAGELTGLGGVDRSLVEGEIAGCAAAGRDDLALKCFPMRERAHRFADGLNQAFALRKQLQLLPEERTIVCRCEDVPHGKLNGAESWRSAKLHFRCGMGPCQGRICGPAVEFLYGWNRQSVRPPIFPVRVTSLISESKYIIEEGINK